MRGTDLSAPFPNLTYTSLTEQEIMEDWQVPLMRVMAAHVAEAHGDVLEIGFGRRRFRASSFSRSVCDPT